jgi:hypothetical protein
MVGEKNFTVGKDYIGNYSKKSRQAENEYVFSAYAKEN